MPFFAGTQKTRWTTFTLWSTLGLLVGAGQFIAVGWAAAAGLQATELLQPAIQFIPEHAVAIVIFLLGAFASYKLLTRRSFRRLCVALTLWAGLLASLNYVHFFTGVAYAQSWQPTETQVETYKVYPGRAPVYDAQPINLVYKGESPAALMQQLGWVKNHTFSRDDIPFNQYIALLMQNRPPVSDLYWNGIPQHSAYQLPGSLTHRYHVRWWKTENEGNTPIWMGAVSYDNGLKVAHYNGILTVLHSIDPQTDKTRDKLAAGIPAGQWHVRITYPVPPQEKDEEHDYSTDGGVIVISEQVVK